MTRLIPAARICSHLAFTECPGRLPSIRWRGFIRSPLSATSRLLSPSSSKAYSPVWKGMAPAGVSAMRTPRPSSPRMVFRSSASRDQSAAILSSPEIDSTGRGGSSNGAPTGPSARRIISNQSRPRIHSASSNAANGAHGAIMRNSMKSPPMRITYPRCSATAHDMAGERETTSRKIALPRPVAMATAGGRSHP